jgi:hypothetical protein
MDNNDNQNRRGNGHVVVQTQNVYDEDAVYLSMVDRHRWLVDCINRLQDYTELASIRILNSVIRCVIYLILLVYGAQYWENVDSKMSKLYNTEQAFRFVKQYDLGKLYVSDKCIFHDGNTQYVTDYFEKIVVLIINFGHLPVTNRELENLCIRVVSHIQTLKMQPHLP